MEKRKRCLIFYTALLFLLLITLVEMGISLLFPQFFYPSEATLYLTFLPFLINTPNTVVMFTFLYALCYLFVMHRYLFTVKDDTIMYIEGKKHLLLPLFGVGFPGLLLRLMSAPLELEFFSIYILFALLCETGYEYVRLSF